MELRGKKCQRFLGAAREFVYTPHFQNFHCAGGPAQEYVFIRALAFLGGAALNNLRRNSIGPFTSRQTVWRLPLGGAALQRCDNLPINVGFTRRGKEPLQKSAFPQPVMPPRPKKSALSPLRYLNLVVIVMGVVGVGKTSVASRLAQELGWQFFDADSFHSPANIAKISAGIPLEDADRAPWLESLHSEIQRCLLEHRHATLACSALKQKYRDQLTTGFNLEHDGVRFVYLKASFDVIQRRLQQRLGHFATQNLLPSQLETIEEPTDAITIDADNSVEQIVIEIRRQLKI